MTNEQAKQEAIKKAYVELMDYSDYELLESKIDEYGRVKYSDINSIIILSHISWDKTYSKNLTWFRPKSLSSIENNNGWIRIEPDGSNLPTSEEVVKWINFYSGDSKQFCIDDRIDVGDFTHYKPIKEELKPVY